MLFSKDTATHPRHQQGPVYAWKKGIKTIYYIRLRQLALEGTAGRQLRLLHLVMQ